ncbi:UNVERIFIED_CONTAM: Pentatricopeptide repeat-containing protein, chloroplastic [Sesamum latifolium]|uniref:Pentatricopeptide repeat-containing protein, chloroplastic n=1 Tax=Sesamum latifolium TaxID=2727402 RepID=A0AAW2UYX8_9LAMI
MEKKCDNAGGFPGEKYPESPAIADQEKAAVDCFYEKLGKLNESSGLSSVFNFREALLDLHLFYKEVIKRGGFYQVTKVGKWDDVASASNLRSSMSISAAQLQNVYELLLLQYELMYCRNMPEEAKIWPDKSSLGFLNSGFGPSCSTGKRKHYECSSPITTVHSGDPAPADIWKPTNNSCLVAAGAKTVHQNSSMITLSNSNTKEFSPDPDAPLKPRSGYQIFLRLETHRLKMIHGESSSSQNLRELAIDAWRCLSEKDKQEQREENRGCGSSAAARLGNPSELLHSNYMGGQELWNLEQAAGDMGILNTSIITELPYLPPPAEHDLTENPSQKTILNILNTKCTDSLENLKQAHALILKTGHFRDHYIAGSLLKCYANPKFGSLSSSLRVLEQVYEPNVFVWNCIIKGCMDLREPFKAVSMYYKMAISGSRPNKYTYPPLFKACTLEQAIGEGLQIHGHVVKLGLNADVHIISAGIQMYASLGRLSEARNMLETIGKSDVICCNAMIDGYMKFGDVEAAKDLFEIMKEKRISSWNTMISGLCINEMIAEAEKYFNEMPEKDEVSWSAMIDGYNKGGYSKEALEVLFSRVHWLLVLMWVLLIKGNGFMLI